MNTDLQTSEAGVNLVVASEGCKLVPYLCPAQVPTIGVGSTINAAGKPVTLKDAPITREVAFKLLHRDLKASEDAVKALVHVPLKQGQFDALVDFVYNLGRGRLETSTMLRLLNQAKYQEAGQQLLRWVRAGTAVLPGLVTRRKAALALWEA